MNLYLDYRFEAPALYPQFNLIPRPYTVPFRELPSYLVSVTKMPVIFDGSRVNSTVVAGYKRPYAQNKRPFAKNYDLKFPHSRQRVVYKTFLCKVYDRLKYMVFKYTVLKESVYVNN